MFISLHDLKLHNIDFKEELRPDAMDYGPDVQQILPLRSSGRAELIEEQILAILQPPIRHGDAKLSHQEGVADRYFPAPHFPRHAATGVGPEI